ncbi:MAG: hypothetical protein R3A11_06920 [Bdellovibrionota bacterium]
MKDSVRPLLLNKVPKPKCKALPTWVWCGDRPVDLEIGCGVGRHPMLYTQRNLHRILIAIEKSPVRFRTMMQEVSERDDLSNLVTLNEHAVSALVHLIPERSIENVFFSIQILIPRPRKKFEMACTFLHAQGIGGGERRFSYHFAQQYFFVCGRGQVVLPKRLESFDFGGKPSKKKSCAMDPF